MVQLRRIRELRENKNLSQKQLADAIYLNYRTIGHYENCRLEPNVDTIKKLCKFFDVSADYLLGLED